MSGKQFLRKEPKVIPLGAHFEIERLQAALRKILFECDTIEAAARVAREALPATDGGSEHG